MINLKKIIVLMIVIAGLMLPVITKNVFWAVFLGRIMGSVFLTTAAWALLEIAKQPAFGISALAGISVYANALLVKYAGVDPWLGIVLGLVIATIFGMLLSVPSMKIGGIMNQGILNIFFIFAFIALIAAFSKYTGGAAGMALGILPPKNIFSQIPYKYMVIMILSVIGVSAIYWIIRTRIGKIISLTAKNEKLASTLGINVTKYKRLAYLLFVPFVALAGFCSSYTTGFTSSSYWSVELSFMTILAFWIGGSGTIMGPIVGAAIISSIPTLFNLAMEWRIVICGILALIIRMFLPEGVVGLFSKLFALAHGKIKGQDVPVNSKARKQRG